MINKLKNFYLDDHIDLLILLYVINLFTNVPHDLIIGGIAKRWHFLESKIDIPYNEFLVALRLILDSTFFSFNDTIYKQIFGTLMISLLSPIVMQDLEDKTISSLSFLLFISDMLILF